MSALRAQPAIYNALKRHDAAITVWVDGIAASIASMIAMAGDEVVMPENGMLMLHDPSGLVMGTAADMRAMAEALDKMKAGMVAAYRDKSDRDDAEIESLMRAETWLSAQEAVDLGLADRVEQPVRMAAHFDLSRFRSPPPQLVAMTPNASPQEDDMSDSRKVSPRKPSLDESAAPQAAPPETTRRRARQASRPPSRSRSPLPQTAHRSLRRRRLAQHTEIDFDLDNATPAPEASSRRGATTSGARSRTSSAHSPMTMSMRFAAPISSTT
jgi:ATP-dependent Clp protease, protease subunit